MSKPEARNQPLINAEKIKAPTQIVWGDSDNVRRNILHIYLYCLVTLKVKRVETNSI